MNRKDIIVFNLLEEKKSLKYFTDKRKTEKKVMPNGEMKHRHMMPRLTYEPPAKLVTSLSVVSAP